MVNSKIQNINGELNEDDKHKLKGERYNEVLLDWKSYDDDIYVYNIKIHYTNFTTDYLDWETVVWEEISNNYYFVITNQR